MEGTTSRVECYDTPQAIFRTIFENGDNHRKAQLWLEAHGFDPVTADVFGRRKDKSDVSKAASLARRAVLDNVVRLISRYDDTGYNDKPADMSVFDYWLAHVEYKTLVKLRFRVH